MSAQCEARVTCSTCDGYGLVGLHGWLDPDTDEVRPPGECASCDGFGALRCAERSAGRHESGRQLCSAHARWQLPHVPVAPDNDPPF